MKIKSKILFTIFRRISIINDKSIRSYNEFLQIAASMIILNINCNL